MTALIVAVGACCMAAGILFGVAGTIVFYPPPGRCGRRRRRKR